MKTVVIGSRNFDDYATLVATLVGEPISELVTGGATGADALAARYARERGLKLTEIQANWPKHGRSAGPIRNAELVKRAERVIAFWDGKSPGTKDTINKAKAAGKPVQIVYTKQRPDAGQTSLF